MSEVSEVETRQAQRKHDQEAGVTRIGVGPMLNDAIQDIDTLLGVVEGFHASKINEYVWERMYRDLLCVMQPEAIPQWFDTEVPALDNRSPRKAWNDGDMVAVARVAWSYLDTSYA